MTNQTVFVAARHTQATDPNTSSAKRASLPHNRFPCVGLLTSALLAAGFLPGHAIAAMTCGNRIIDRGTSGAEVTSFCGAPTQVDRTAAFRRGAVTADRDREPTGIGADVQIEFWTYNFGPNQLMERVRIEDGVVVEVQSLRYGFNDE
jgi:hypothetical protein